MRNSFAAAAVLVPLTIFYALVAAGREDVVGTVAGETGPLAGACVRWQATAVQTTTDAAGRYRLAPVEGGQRVTAWKLGFLIAGGVPRAGRIDFKLVPIPDEDDADYEWVDPRPLRSQSGRCANCHAEIYREWAGSAHGRSGSNARFLEMYAGAAEPRDAAGDWNLLREMPHGASVCAACHAPTVEPTAPGFDDFRSITEVDRLGVHCDFCHKVVDVSTARLGHEHGKFAMELRRPREGQLFFGPLDDVDRGEDSFLPLYRESRYCASCHEGTVLGAKVYSTYSEWLASPARRQGQQCQDCHMKPTGTMSNFAPGNGGLERDPNTLASHHTPGAKLLKAQSAVRMTVTSTASPAGWRVQVELLAQNVGHRVPTGFLDRHLLLTLSAVDGMGKEVIPEAGPCIPKGVDPKFSGRHGLFMGRLITDEAGNSPVPFWRFAKEIADSRLQPEQPLRVEWTLPHAAARVQFRLLYRPFFEAVRLAKGWPIDELLVTEETVELSRSGTADPPLAGKD